MDGFIRVHSYPFVDNIILQNEAKIGYDCLV
jgi:hypothetical protein